MWDANSHANHHHTKDLKPEALAETNVEFPLEISKACVVIGYELFNVGFRKNPK